MAKDQLHRITSQIDQLRTGERELAVLEREATAIHLGASQCLCMPLGHLVARSGDACLHTTRQGAAGRSGALSCALDWWEVVFSCSQATL